MKRRIFLYNAVVVIVALTALLIVSGVVIRNVNDHYLQRPPLVDDNVPKAQQTMTEWIAAPSSWEALSGQLQDLGYSLYVSLRGAEVYSSMAPSPAVDGRRSGHRHALRPLHHSGHE